MGDKRERGRERERIREKSSLFIKAKRRKYQHCINIVLTLH
jgi:hypothetical protein